MAESAVLLLEEPKPAYVHLHKQYAKARACRPRYRAFLGDPDENGRILHEVEHRMSELTCMTKHDSSAGRHLGHTHMMAMVELW